METNQYPDYWRDYSAVNCPSAAIDDLDEATIEVPSKVDGYWRQFTCHDLVKGRASYTSRAFLSVMVSLPPETHPFLERLERLGFVQSGAENKYVLRGRFGRYARWMDCHFPDAEWDLDEKRELFMKQVCSR